MQGRLHGAGDFEIGLEGKGWTYPGPQLPHLFSVRPWAGPALLWASISLHEKLGPPRVGLPGELESSHLPSLTVPRPYPESPLRYRHGFPTRHWNGVGSHTLASRVTELRARGWEMDAGQHLKRFRLPCPADAAEEKTEPGASLVEDPRPAGRSGLSSSFPILSFHLALRLATCLSF